MNRKDQILGVLNEHPELKNDLFIRGFLISDSREYDWSAFPFYGNWKHEEHCGFTFASHNLTGMHIVEDGKGNVFFLMGHAYDPFAMEIDEKILLRHLAEAYGTPDYMDRVNDLTGIFILGSLVNGKLEYLVDPSGMQSACSGIVGGCFYLASHAQLVGDLCGLTMDPFVKELTRYKWYGRVMGPYLPGDLTPFSDLKRVVPSILYCFDGQITHERFWPLQDIAAADSGGDYQSVIDAASDILRRNMILVSQKWEHPWISLTGGIDSNTTFAAANGNYGKFNTFSYISAEKEIPDAAAAKTIAEHFGVPHHEYHIPASNEAISGFEARRELFRHNNGYVAELYDNELRKKLYLQDNTPCDVEVKSWVSETVRAYWYKHYGRRSFPKLSGKLFRNLYKIFITDRSLAHKVDKLFDRYIRDYAYDRIPASYPPADMHYNEVTWGSWGGLNITEMKYCFDITVIYNNRRFLDLMFRVPLSKRISDQHHLDMKKELNPELYDLGIRVVNMKETRFRAFALNVIFTLNCLLP